MNILKRTLAGLLIVFLAFGQVTSIPGGVDSVMGFSNLTTANRMVRVSAAGTVTETTDFIRTGAGLYQFYESGGATTLTVRAGTGQSSTHLGNFIASNGATYAGLANNGTLFSTDYVSSLSSPVFVLAAGTWNTRGLAVTSDFPILWSNSTTNSGATKDLGLARSSANNLGITNGASTTYATIGADGIILNNGRFQIPTSTPASASATCTTGTIAWDTNFTYVCVATDTWKRAAIATW